MLKLDIYANGRAAKPEKTVTCEEYTISYGILQDVLEIEEIQRSNKASDVKRMINIFDPIVRDIFPDLTNEDVRKIRLDGLMSLMADMVDYATGNIGDDTTKNA